MAFMISGLGIDASDMVAASLVDGAVEQDLLNACGQPFPLCVGPVVP
jgi:hypothetical protein